MYWAMSVTFLVPDGRDRKLMSTWVQMICYGELLLGNIAYAYNNYNWTDECKYGIYGLQNVN